MSNIEQLKIFTVISLLLGLILGVLGTIPFIGSIAALALFLLSSPLMYIYGMKYFSLKLENVEQSLIFGASVGFISLVGFSISFSLIAFLLTLFFTIDSLIWAKSLFSQGLFVPLMLIIFIGILSALTNGFTSLAVYWLMGYKK